MTNTEMQRRQVVYIGARRWSGDTPSAVYRFVEADGSLGSIDLSFDRKSKLMGKADLGSVYEIGVGADGVSFSGPRNWLTCWKDARDLLVWRAADDLVRAQERADKAERDGKREAVERAMAVLNPLRDLHQSTDTVGRVLLEAQVLAYLRRTLRP